MLYNGAKGETAAELKQVLGFHKHNVSDDQINEGFNALLTQINSENNKIEKKYQLDIANRLIAHDEFRILTNFWNTLNHYYKADIQSVNFVKDGQNAVNQINDWIKTKTNKKIEKIFDEPLDPMTKLVIINVVYFKGLIFSQV